MKDSYKMKMYKRSVYKSYAIAFAVGIPFWTIVGLLLLWIGGVAR